MSVFKDDRYVCSVADFEIERDRESGGLCCKFTKNWRAIPGLIKDDKCDSRGWHAARLSDNPGLIGHIKTYCDMDGEYDVLYLAGGSLTVVNGCQKESLRNFREKNYKSRHIKN